MGGAVKKNVARIRILLEDVSASLQSLPRLSVDDIKKTAYVDNIFDSLNDMIFKNASCDVVLLLNYDTDVFVKLEEARTALDEMESRGRPSKRPPSPVSRVTRSKRARNENFSYIAPEVVPKAELIESEDWAPKDEPVDDQGAENQDMTSWRGGFDICANDEDGAPIREKGHVKEEVMDEEEVYDTDEGKRQRLKWLLRKLVLETDKSQLNEEEEFDVLFGNPPSYYGLSETVRLWKKELYVLIRKCPLLTREELRVLSMLINKQDHQSIIAETAPLLNFLTGHHHNKIAAGLKLGRKDNVKYRFLKRSKILNELRIFGFSRFNNFSDDEIDAFKAKNPDVDDLSICAKKKIERSYIESENNVTLCKLQINDEDDVYGEKKKRSRIGTGKTGRVVPSLSLPRNRYKSFKIQENPCDEWLVQQDQKPIRVTFKDTPFTEGIVCSHSYKVQRPLRLEKTFAIVGMITTEDPGNKVMGRVLVRSPFVQGSDPDTEIQDLAFVFQNSFGFTKEEIMKKSHNYMGLSIRYYVDPRKDVETRLMAMSREELEIDLMETRQEFNEELVRKNRNTIVDPTPPPGENDRALSLLLDQTLDLTKINNIGVLMGTNPDDIKLRVLLTDSILDKCLQNSLWMDRLKNKTASEAAKEGKELNNTFMWYIFLCIFDYFHNVEGKDGKGQFAQRAPVFVKFLEDFRSLHSLVKFYDLLLNRDEKQCTSCGKVFSVAPNTVEISRFKFHTKQCELELATCDCPGITFRTPAEKRKHMRVVHSGLSYLECSHCSFITRQQPVLDKHIEFTHGVPGSEKQCDLCPKSFKCQYHLNIHRFNHEVHLCEFCNIEILGRIAFKNHMKKIHKAGFTCQECGKVMFTKKELVIHKKMEHEERPWTSA